MSHEVPTGNPFMLMLNPEVVLAAVERSERLSRLNRHTCRPLDRPLGAAVRPYAEFSTAGGIHLDDAVDDDETVVAEDNGGDAAVAA